MPKITFFCEFYEYFRLKLTAFKKPNKILIKQLTKWTE